MVCVLSGRWITNCANRDTHSDSCSIKCGVPQGSILGPLLILIYFNDMRAAVNCQLLLYADGSALRAWYMYVCCYRFELISPILIQLHWHPNQKYINKY